MEHDGQPIVRFADEPIIATGRPALKQRRSGSQTARTYEILRRRHYDDGAAIEMR